MAKNKNEENKESAEIQNTAPEQSKDSSPEQDNKTSQNDAENTESSSVQDEQAEQEKIENPENQNPAPVQNQTAQNQPAKDNEKSKKKDLIPFRQLVSKYRLPTWQSAAILKLLDKEDDVYLSEQEFLQAVEKLFNRKMGA